MSVEAIAWASKQRTGSPGAKLVLIALANYANDRCECWPSQATLAEWTEQSDRTIRTHLAGLESMGLIHRQAREVAGSFTSDLITLNLAQRQILPVEKFFDGKNSRFRRKNFPGNRQKNHQLNPIGVRAFLTISSLANSTSSWPTNCRSTWPPSSHPSPTTTAARAAFSKIGTPPFAHGCATPAASSARQQPRPPAESRAAIPVSTR